MNVLLENHLRIVKCTFNGVDNVFNECMVMQNIVQRLVKMSPNNNGENLVQEIEKNQMIWKEKMSNLHQWLIDAVNKVSQLIKTYSNTKEYYQDFQINQISRSQPAPFDRIDVCFEKYVQFINMVKVFKLQNNEMYERGLSSGASFESNKRFIATIFVKLPQFLTDFISKFIIVTKQPPFCILRDATDKNSDDKNLKNVTNKLDPSNEMPKCPKGFDLELKIYSLNKVLEFVRFNNGEESIAPTVKAIVIGENDYIKWMKGDSAPTEKNKRGDLSESVQNQNQTAKNFERNNGVYTASFSNMRIKKMIRSVTETKQKIERVRFCIMFEIKIGAIKLPGWSDWKDLTSKTSSMPFAMVSNPNQRKAAFPYVCWCRAFIQMENYEIETNETEGKIDWIQFKYRLNDLFCAATNCEPLKDFQLKHLDELLFENECFDGTDSQKKDSKTHFVTLQKILFTPLSSNNGSNIPFWDWFYSTIDFIGNKKVRPYWNGNLICGFMSRETAEMILKQQNQACILIRFSDSVIGGVVFSVFLPNNNNEVIHMFLENTLCNEYVSLYQCYERLCEKYEDMKKIKVICSGPGQFESMEKFKSIQKGKIKENNKVSDVVKFKYFLVQKKLILEGIGVKKIKEIKSKQCPAGAIGSAEVASSLEVHMNNLDLISRTSSCSSNVSACSAEIVSELTESDWSLIRQLYDNNPSTNWTRGESSESALSDSEMHEVDYTPHHFSDSEMHEDNYMPYHGLLRTPSADMTNQFIYLNNEDQLPEIRYVDEYFYNPQNSMIPQNNFSSL